jgi:hypothetical protein
MFTLAIYFSSGMPACCHAPIPPRSTGAGSGTASDDDRSRLELFQFLHALDELCFRNVSRVGDVARTIFRRVAQIDHHRVAPIDELHGFHRARLMTRPDQPADQRPDQHAAGDDGGPQEHQVQGILLQKCQKLFQP